MSNVFQPCFGPSQGIVAGLREQIGRQFQVDAAPIPDAWIYWPLTAGGLGLQNPLVTAGQYAESHRNRKRREPPCERPRNGDRRGKQEGRRNSESQ